MFSGISLADHLSLIRHRVDNASFSELLYADATVLLSTCARAMHRYSHELERVAPTYGLCINQSKTKHLRIHTRARLRHLDDLVVSTADYYTYLGVLNSTMGDEIRTRKAKGMAAWQSMFSYWRHVNLPHRTKLIVYRTVIQALFTYG